MSAAGFNSQRGLTDVSRDNVGLGELIASLIQL